MQKRCFPGALILCLCFAGPLLSQQLNFKTFSFNEGLKTYNISGTLQDNHGFIWAATQDGLYRFNGKEFQVFKNNTANEAATLGNIFLDIALDNKNNIYGADYSKGFDIINTTTLEVKHTGPEELNQYKLPNYWIWNILIDKEQNTWLRGIDYLAFKREKDNTFTIVSAINGISGRFTPVFIKPFGKDHVAIGVEGHGTIIYNIHTLEKKEVIRRFGTLSAAGTDEIKDITLCGDTLLLATTNSLIKGLYKNEHWQFIKEYKNPVFATAVVKSIVCDKHGIVWAGTNNGLIRANLQQENTVLYQVIPGKTRWLADNTINNLMIDRQGNLWISTSSVLQMVNTEQNGFTSFSGGGDEGEPIEHIYTLSTKNENELFATGTNGLFEVNIKNGFSKKIPGTSTLGYVHHIEPIEDNWWVLSTDAGMYAYNPVQNILSQEVLLNKYPEWQPFKKNYFNTAYRIKNTWYWASEELEGLIKWDKDNGTATQYKAGTSSSHGLPENHLRNLKPDRDGFLWILSDLTASKFDTRTDTVVQILRYGKNSFNASTLYDLYDDGRTLWFATYGGGINGYNKKTGAWTYFTERNGLCNNSVYGILPENDTVIWATTNMGLSRINTRSLICNNYYYEDGLQDNSFDEKGTLKAADKFYFGGVKGFTQLDLSHFHQQQLEFPVYMHRVEYYTNGEKKTLNNLQWNKLVLPAGSSPVILHLSALNFTGNSKIRFTYRIAGVQDNFIEADEKNTITLSGLNYGHHKIQVRCRKEDGTFVNKDLTLDIYIKPKWHQTWWFKSLALLSLFAAGYGLYKMRINQLKKEHQIRTKLASDLHDDLGSTMNSVKVYANLAIMEKQADKYLPLIKEGTQDAISGIRDIIWVLDDTKDSIDDLLSRISSFASPLCEASVIKYRQDIADDSRDHKLGQEERRNLYMIMKEAVNNAIKYAGCNNIDINITSSKGKLSIQIKDDGKGFDSVTTSQGNGLKNIQRRAKEIKYAVLVDSSVGKGTTITLTKL